MSESSAAAAGSFVEAPRGAPGRRIAITHTMEWAGVTWLLLINYDRAGAAIGAWLEPTTVCDHELSVRAHAAGVVASRHLQNGKTLAELIYKTAPGRPAADAVTRAVARAVQFAEPKDRPSVVMAYECLEQRLAKEAKA